MATIEKILILDKAIEKLTEEEMTQYRFEYMAYAEKMHKFVTDNLNVSDRDIKNMVYKNILSHFQYFLEDQIRNKRNDDGKFKNPFDIPYPRN